MQGNSCNSNWNWKLNLPTSKSIQEAAGETACSPRGPDYCESGNKVDLWPSRLVGLLIWQAHKRQNVWMKKQQGCARSKWKQWLRFVDRFCRMNSMLLKLNQDDGTSANTSVAARRTGAMVLQQKSGLKTESWVSRGLRKRRSAAELCPRERSKIECCRENQNRRDGWEQTPKCS